MNGQYQIHPDEFHHGKSLWTMTPNSDCTITNTLYILWYSDILTWAITNSLGPPDHDTDTNPDTADVGSPTESAYTAYTYCVEGGEDNPSTCTHWYNIDTIETSSGKCPTLSCTNVTITNAVNTVCNGLFTVFPSASNPINNTYFEAKNIMYLYYNLPNGKWYIAHEYEHLSCEPTEGVVECGQSQEHLWLSVLPNQTINWKLSDGSVATFGCDRYVQYYSLCFVADNFNMLLVVFSVPYNYKQLSLQPILWKSRYLQIHHGHQE